MARSLLAALLPLGMAALPTQAAPLLLEAPIPDSATGAVVAPAASAIPAATPAASAQPAATPATSTPAALPPPPRPEAPALVPGSVSVGDLALLEPADEPVSDGPVPPAPLHYPLPVAPSESDPWGWRFSSTHGSWRMHTGVDLIAPEGTAVLAVLAGRVQRVEEIAGYGLTVLVDHGGGWSSLYAHLLEASVSPGTNLSAGQPLGLVGQSGNASGPHLHLEVRQRQRQGLVAVDPTPLLPVPPPP